MYQADGQSSLNMIGETNITLSRDNHCFTLEALVVDNIDVGVLAGVPFMTVNDIRPSQRQILLSDGTILEYCAQPFHGAHAVRRAHACVLRAPLLQLQCGPGISLSYKFPLTIFLKTLSSPWSLEQMSILFNKWTLIHGPFHASYRVSVVKSTSRNLPQPLWGWTMCFLLMTLLPAQKLCVNICIYICTFLIRALL